MEVTLKQAFSILDGRLSTEMGDVYKMLNYIFDQEFLTHQLPSAMRKLKEVNPDWFSKEVDHLKMIGVVAQTDDFDALMRIIDEKYSDYTIKLGKVDAKIDFLAGLVKTD